MGDHWAGVDIVQQLPAIHVGVLSHNRGAALTYPTVCRREEKYMETDLCTRHTETYVIPLMDWPANIDKSRTFPFSASDPQCSRRSWMPACGMGRGTSKSRPPGNAGNFFRQADVVAISVVTLFNDLPRENMGPFSVLTGVFLFGSTTAGSSGGLLGWNCGYAFCSNVSAVMLFLTWNDW